MKIDTIRTRGSWVTLLTWVRVFMWTFVQLQRIYIMCISGCLHSSVTNCRYQEKDLLRFFSLLTGGPLLVQVISFVFFIANWSNPPLHHNCGLFLKPDEFKVLYLILLLLHTCIIVINSQVVVSLFFRRVFFYWFLWWTTN